MYKKSLMYCAMILFGTTIATERNKLFEAYYFPLPWYPHTFTIVRSDNIFAYGKILKPFEELFVTFQDPCQSLSLTQLSVVNTIQGKPASYALTECCPELITVNKEPAQPNPLYDKTFLFCSTYDKCPIMVTVDEPAVVCLIDSVVTASPQELLQSPHLNDAQGDPAETIIALTVGLTGTQEHALSPYIFAALKASESDPYTLPDIAVIKYDTTLIKTVTHQPDGRETTIDVRNNFINVLDATLGSNHGNKAISLTNEMLSPHTADFKARITDMCWNPYVERLYIGFEIVAGPSVGSEHVIQGLIVGRLNKDLQLCFDSIASNNFLSNEKSIISGRGPQACVVMHKVRALQTTTGLSYLVVVGGNGSYEATASNVYALPLIDRSFNYNRDEIMQDSLHGTLASSESIPMHRYVGTKLGSKLIGGAYHQEEQAPLPTINSTTGVGGTTKLPNTIQDIVIVGDTVFVSVNAQGNGQLPGIFYSQALLDGLGRIASWSEWKRFGGIQDGVEKMLINTEQGFFGYTCSNQAAFFCHMTHDEPKNKRSEKEIEESDDITDLIAELLPEQKGGVQGIYDFNWQKPGLGQEHRISFLAITGYKKLILIESGRDDADGIFFGYQKGFKQDVVQCINGSIPETFDTVLLNGPRVLEFTGGSIEQLGPITQATVVTDGQQSWLVVGGSQGLAILCDEHGKGWDCSTGLLPHFGGLKSGMAFRKIGSYNYVKKLIGDRGNLYVATPTTCERIKLSSEIIKSNAYQPTLLASNKQVGTFFDIGISGPLAILATSKGLWYNAAQTDCSIDEIASLGWRKVAFAQHVSRVSKLYFVEHSLKKGFSSGAQLYVMARTGNDYATSVYRLYIDDVESCGVQESSVQLLSDHIFAQKPIPFFSFNSDRTVFMTNGAHYMVGSSATINSKPFAHLITLPSIKKPVKSEPQTFTIPLNISKTSKNISAVVHNSATGNWFIAGDFGIRIYN